MDKVSKVLSALLALFFVIVLLWNLPVLFTPKSVMQPWCWIGLAGYIAAICIAYKFSIKSSKKAPAVLFLLALLLRLGFVLAFPAELSGDAQAYFHDAMVFATQSGEELLYNYATGWPSHIIFVTFTAGLMRVTGTSLLAIKIWQCIFSAFAIPVCWMIAKRFLNPRMAYVSAFLLAIAPMHIANCALLSNQNLSTTLLLCAVLSCLSQPFSKRYANYILTGILFALANAIRPDIMPFLLAAMLFIIMKEPSLRSVVYAGTVCVAFFVAMYTFQFIYQGAGLIERPIMGINPACKIMVGLNPDSVGTHTAEDQAWASPALTDFSEEELNRRAWERIHERTADKALLLQHIYNKTEYMWSGRNNIMHLMYKGSPEIVSTEAANRYTGFCKAFMTMLFALCVSALLSYKNISGDIWLCVIMVGAFVAVYFLIEVSPRYMHCILPLLCIIATAQTTFAEGISKRLVKPIAVLP